MHILSYFWYQNWLNQNNMSIYSISYILSKLLAKYLLIFSLIEFRIDSSWYKTITCITYNQNVPLLLQLLRMLVLGSILLWNNLYINSYIIFLKVPYNHEELHNQREINHKTNELYQHLNQNKKNKNNKKNIWKVNLTFKNLVINYMYLFKRQVLD